MLERRYRVDAPLARGGMSSVYRGMDLRLDRPVAIKVMEAAFAGDQSFIDRFELEARAAARLHHPGVVAVHDQGVDGDNVYLVMELVDGGTLRDLLRRGPLSVPLALSVLDPVLSALAAAHRAGLVHRDVKPENVLIGQGGAVKVADFGLVRAIAQAGSTSDSTILGTVAYLSPEQVTTGVADARSDVYAAGVMLYEMLTGCPPYQGDTPISVAYRHVNDDVPPPSEAVPGIPAALDDLVLRATRRDPALRPADAAAFLLELSRTRGSLGLPRVPVPVPVAEDTAAGQDEDTQTVSAVAVADAARAAGADDPPAARTIRTAPVRNAGVGPQGTRAWTRDELGVGAVGTMGRPAPALQGPPPGTPLGPPPGAHHPGYPPPVGGYQAHRQRSRRTFVIWIAVVLVLAAVVGAVAWWLGTGRWTAVPQLTGLDPAAAERALQTADLSGTITQQRDNTVPPGQVIGTDPATGSRALRGSTVTVEVSEGRPIVPDIVPGAAANAVQGQIRAAQLTPVHDPTKDAYDDNVPKGAVVRVVPGPGTQLNLDSPVTVVLSLGRAPRPVPNVVGQPHDQAFAALRQAGFQPFDEPAAFSDQVDGNVVLRTDPPTGTTIAADGNLRVGVVVSNAVTVPNLTGQQAEAAAQALAALKLQPQVQALAGDPNGQVFAQSPAAGTRVAPGSTVAIGVFP